MNAVVHERYEVSMLTSEAIEVHLASLRAGQDELREDVRELRGDYKSLREKVDAVNTTLGNRIDSLSNRMDALNANLSEKISKLSDDVSDMRGLQKAMLWVVAALARSTSPEGFSIGSERGTRIHSARVRAGMTCDARQAGRRLQIAPVRLHVHTADREYLLRRTLQDLLQQLGEERFKRIHKSAAVKVSQIAALERMPKGDYEVRLRSGARLRLSRRYASALLMKSPS